jgi:hypothetical protein
VWLVGYAAAVVVVVAVAANVLAKGMRDYWATGWHSVRNTVVAVNVGLVVPGVRTGLDMDRPSDCSLSIAVPQLLGQKGG